MPPAIDIGAKRLIGLAPDAWARWVLQRPDVVAGDMLTTEFQWVSRQTDALMRVSSDEAGDFLLLTELQARHDPWMPQRIHAYAALAEARYRLPVYPVVVNITQPPASTIIPTATSGCCSACRPAATIGC